MARTSAMCCKKGWVLVSCRVPSPLRETSILGTRLRDEMKFKVWWKALYQRIITRSSNLGILLIYHANLWKYNSQKALDTFLCGKPQQTSHVPFMITRKMRKSLSSLGYSERDIDKMTPTEASDTVNRCIRKSTKALSSSQSQKD